MNLKFCVYRDVRIRVFKVGIDVMCNASPSVTCDAVATQMSQQFSLQQYNCFHQPAASTHSLLNWAISRISSTHMISNMSPHGAGEGKTSTEK